MPTIRDVAKHAGVAPITVSRVINDSGYVSQATRTRVEEAIDTLGYVPNMLGQSLRFKQTMTLALVLTDITNPFWTTVARGVEDVAQANGYSIILCNTDESKAKQEQYLNMLLRRRIDGIILVPTNSSSAPVHTIQRQDIPVVLLDRQLPDPDLRVDIVRAESESGAYQLTEHLLSLGHRHITMLAGPKTVSTAVDRVSGYQRALAEAGLEDTSPQVYWGEFTIENGREMARQALADTPKPTALFASNNFIAVGAIQALREQGLSVPDDIALVTVDDIPPAFTMDPFLTVATQPALEMGRRAAELLLGRVTGKLDTECQHIIFPTQMIIRASSGDRLDS
jgi:LacI family transcriptional regulator